jgi:hypothetical protein
MTKTKAKREPTYLLDCVLPPTDVTADGFLAKHNGLPSYFYAINFRCQANKVSGVTIVATCASNFRPSIFALAARRRSLAVAESHPSITNLFSKNAIFLDEIFDHAMLTLIYPTRDGDD